jgi:uncharacterized protein
VLAEAIRLGTGPLAILLAGPDEILVLCAPVAEYLYERTCPILVLPEAGRSVIATGDHVAVARDGTVAVAVAPSNSATTPESP